MRKLTENEVERLRGLETEKFMEKLENIYKDDEEILMEIQKCKSMKESLQWIETYPAYAGQTSSSSADHDNVYNIVPLLFGSP